MDLTNIPLPYRHDRGKLLEGEEKERAAREATPLDSYKPHCVVQSDNCNYRARFRKANKY